MGKISKAISAGLSMFQLRKATADASQVLEGSTFYAGNKELKKGTMPNKAGWGKTLDPGTEVAIPKGYHPGTTKVSARNITAADVMSKAMTAGIVCSNGNNDVGSDKYIIGLVNVDCRRYPGDYTAQPGEMWGVSIYDGHTIASSAADSTKPYVTYRYIPV